MNQNSVTFKSEKLQVDFLTLSIKYLGTNEIANYFFQCHGFNSFLSEGNSRRISQELFYDGSTKLTIIIRVNFWGKNLLEISGRSAAEFYKLLKSNSIDLKFFDGASITRIDLCLDSKIDEFFDEAKFDQFLIQTRHEILASTRLKTKHVKLLTENRGSLLGVNKRSNANDEMV